MKRKHTTNGIKSSSLTIGKMVLMVVLGFDRLIPRQTIVDFDFQCLVRLPLLLLFRVQIEAVLFVLFALWLISSASGLASVRLITDA